MFIARFLTLSLSSILFTPYRIIYDKLHGIAALPVVTAQNPGNVESRPLRIQQRFA